MATSFRAPALGLIVDNFSNETLRTAPPPRPRVRRAATAAGEGHAA